MTNYQLIIEGEKQDVFVVNSESETAAYDVLEKMGGYPRDSIYLEEIEFYVPSMFSNCIMDSSSIKTFSSSYQN